MKTWRSLTPTTHYLLLWDCMWDSRCICIWSYWYRLCIISLC